MGRGQNGVERGPHTSDEGLFGPESISWRLMANPATGIGAGAAAMIHMLYPPVMYVVDQSSNVREDPERRAQRTSDYATTITYGDVAAAEQAGATLRRIHTRCTAVHPDTGEAIVADEPHLLVWVHNALTWALLRTWKTFGVPTSATERDQFVEEQKISARLVGCDVDAVASTQAELEAYMESMEPKLAMSAPCVWFKGLMVEKPSEGGVAAVATKALIVQAISAVMSDHHRALYGFSLGPTRKRAVVTATKGLLRVADSKVPFETGVGLLRDHVDTHAFGARRSRPGATEVEEVAI